ncbi:MAG: hypothetical protein J5796_00205 [Erysipelotrichaceae bacterium]|nr:hypothetical protein [Erysipelotrichaceae bacterium]
MKSKHCLLILLITLCMVLSGCQKASGKADSEKAMNNFLRKIEEGNYVIDAKEYLKTTVSSRDQVSFEYAEDIYDDFVVVSIDGEAFQGYPKDGQLTEVKFLGEGQAIDAASGRLPNGWLDDDVSEGNIWNLFYNIQEEPLKFVSYEDAVKQSVMSFVGYGENALPLMHEVYLVLDKEDPTSARLQAEMDEDMVARIFYDDVDLEIRFSDAKSDPAADAWVKSPSYPAARAGWNDTDEFIFNSVFLPGYGLEAVPFPDFASYALVNDGENFVWNDAVSIRDSHASEQDMKDYAEKLLQNGFSQIAENQFVKLLRQEYGCYSLIELEYDNGVNLTAKKYYDFPRYDTLAKINETIGKKGYPALLSSDNFVSFDGTDRASEMTESWLYFYHYDLGLYADIGFKDREEAENYLKSYEETLLDAGFRPVSSSEDEVDYYESENGFSSFRYNFIDDDTVTLLFKSERYTSADETEKMVTDAGFPKIDLSEPISCRDLKEFQKTQYGFDRKAYFTVSQTFDSAEKAEAFLNAYETALNEAGFDRVNPDNVGSSKSIAISNADMDMYVGIDFFPGDDETIVNMEFVAD